MNNKYEDLTLEELKLEREKHVSLLDEYLEERDMLLGQTGHHISSTGLVKKYASLVSETEETIAELDKLLNAKS